MRIKVVVCGITSSALPLTSCMVIYCISNCLKSLSVWVCHLTTPNLFLCLGFQSCKKATNLLLYLHCKWIQHPTVSRYHPQDFFNTILAVATAQKGGRFQFTAFVNHSNHMRKRKHCSSQCATPSMLTTARSTSEPPCDVSQSIYSLEQMNTAYSNISFCFN